MRVLITRALQFWGLEMLSRNLHVCTYVRTYVRMYVRTYVRTYVCMHVCMHACTHIHVYSKREKERCRECESICAVNRTNNNCISTHITYTCRYIGVYVFTHSLLRSSCKKGESPGRRCAILSILPACRHPKL